MKPETQELKLEPTQTRMKMLGSNPNRTRHFATRHNTNYQIINAIGYNICESN